MGTPGTDAQLPYVTPSLPGVGGVLRACPGDFRVEEVPAYAPSGAGDHVLAQVEKTELSTFELVDALARATGVRAADVGTAGMKDRRAVTVQWVSLPSPVTPEAVASLSLPGIRVLAAARHPNKLKTGHLRGNRFQLTVRQLTLPAAEAAERARAILDHLAAVPGCPNGFGPQRFGAAGDNADAGRRLLAGPDRAEAGGRRGPGGKKKRRLLVSAYQSRLFNETLRRRIASGDFGRVLTGDVLKKCDTGGVFVCEDAETDQRRLDAGEVAVTGPMFGHRMRTPAAGTEAFSREAAVLEAEGLTLDAFRPLGKLAPGTRRPLAVRPTGVDVRTDGDALVVLFELPPGAYATSVMREVMKEPSDIRG